MPNGVSRMKVTAELADFGCRSCRIDEHPEGAYKSSPLPCYRKGFIK